MSGDDEYLRKVDSLIIRAVSSLDPVRPTLQAIAAAGARHRARLLFLIAGSRADREPLAAGGAAVEILHLGTLLHDDIVDGAAERRHLPALHVVHGVAGPIWAADALYAEALSLAGSVTGVAGRALGTALHRIAVSQLLESTHPGVDAYWSVVDGKTVSLFDAVFEIAYELLDGTLPGGLRKAVSSFGRLFQYVDDLADIVEEPGLRGKPVGIDARNDLRTLPAADLGESAEVARRRIDELAAAALTPLVGTSYGPAFETVVGELVGSVLPDLERIGSSR